MSAARRELRGRVVVVTGAAGGLGAALARQCAEAGARVAALDLDGAGAEAIAVGLRAQGHDALGLACDVSDEAACHSAIADVVQRLGGIDWLIANAGISARCLLREAAPEVLRRVMAVNFFGAAWCTQAALPSLVQRRGQIVVISSVAGFSPLVGRSAYAASKHALHGFFDSLRSEVEPLGVQVLLVCPSFIRTGIEGNALASDGTPVRHPQAIVGRRSTPEAVAARIVRAAARGERLLLPDRVSRLAWWASRLAPRFYARQMARRLGAEMRAGG